MKAKVQFIFDNIDNSLYTAEKASVVMELHADNYATMVQVAEHMRKVVQADRYFIADTYEDKIERYR